MARPQVEQDLEQGGRWIAQDPGPTAGQKLNISSSLGTVGAITDNGDGSYAVPVQLPPGQDGPITLTGAVGNAQGSIVLPTLANVGAAATAATPTATGPVGTSAVAGGTQKAPKVKAPKSLAGPSGQPWGRLSASLATIPHVYRLESSGDYDVPDEASFENGNLFGGGLFGAPGLDLRGVLWPGDAKLGVDARFRGYIDVVEVGGENYSNFGWDFHAGARYRGEFKPNLWWYGAAGVGHVTGLIFRYADDLKSEAELLGKGLWGARLGGGMIVGLNPLYLDVQLTELFAPFPVDTGVGLGLEFDLPNGIAPRLGMDLDFRSMKFAVGDETVKVKDQEHAITLGCSFLLK